jgi:type VI secretion system protein ImpJ
MDAHEIPESIQWHEGLLLTPQHFQQLALRQESLLQYVSSALAPFNWGVRYVKFDPASLAGGTLRILELEAVMPDSLIVTSGLRRGEDLQLDLAPYAEQIQGRAVAVQLAVAARQSDALTHGEIARYASVEGDPVMDESTGNGSIRIPRLRPRLSLLINDSPPKQYVSLPIAKVIRRDETYALTDFIPPTLAVERQSSLGVMCSMAASRLREKAAYLANQLRVPASGARVGFDIETENLLRSLVTPLPLLEAVLATGVSHPFVVYLALCQVAGHVSVMGRSPVPIEFDAYDHNNLRATFERVLTFISRKVDEGITSTFNAYPFHYEDGVYSVMFDDTWLGRRLVLAMRGQPGSTEQELERWGRECLIGSRPNMRLMRENRILGARREQIERDEDLVPPRGSVLFRLWADPEFVEPDEVLEIFNTRGAGQSQRPAEIVLHVKNT